MEALSAIKIDLSRAGKPGETMTEYLPSAIAKLHSLQKGDCPGHELTGWLDWPARHGLSLADKIMEWKEQLLLSWDCVLLCGIGGSYAGTRAVEQALTHRYLSCSEEIRRRERLKPVLYCGHHLAEKELWELLEYLDEKNPLICVISKSGTTTEVGAAFRVIRHYMEKRYGTGSRDRIIAITDQKKGALRALAQEKSYTCFDIPDDIGGRFSVLSGVGLVPLALAGFDVRVLSEGADHFFSSLKTMDDPGMHPAVRLAATRKAAWEEGYCLDILSFREPGLAAFAEWWKQLFGESEGKEGKGLFPSSMLYSTDLHSLGQFLQEGRPCMIQTFLEAGNFDSVDASLEKRLRVPHSPDGKDGLNFLEARCFDEISRAAMEAGMNAHSARGVPCIRIVYPGTSLWSMGLLFAFFELSCAISALMLELNPFNQPGVEAYKQQMFRILGKTENPV